MAVSIRRVYDDSDPEDGFRVLVDRLWPRGLSKKRAQFDEWLKDVAPTTELRRWFHHEPERFDEFVTRYRAELEVNPAVDVLRALVAEHPTVTLLYSAHDTQNNQAVALRDFLAD